LFQDDEYRLGSFCHPDAAVRRRALEHCLECVEIAQRVGSGIISLWVPDGTNYPGQDDLRGRFRRLVEGLEALYAALPDGMRLLIEYKFFEPAFYSTDLPDWGTSALLCRRLGPQAQVLVDTGHHPLGTNIEQIVALLLDGARLAQAQREGDVLGAHRVLLDAYETDVRPLLAELRTGLGVPTDPVEAFRSGGHAERLAGERS